MFGSVIEAGRFALTGKLPHESSNVKPTHNEQLKSYVWKKIRQREDTDMLARASSGPHLSNAKRYVSHKSISPKTPYGIGVWVFGLA